MTHARLAELKRICDAATPGEWEPEMICVDESTGFCEPTGTIIISTDTIRDKVIGSLESLGDLLFVIKSRTALPELITAYEKAVEVLKQTQWGECDSDGNRGCVFCEGEPFTGHAPDCELKKILEDV